MDKDKNVDLRFLLERQNLGAMGDEEITEFAEMAQYHADGKMISHIIEDLLKRARDSERALLTDILTGLKNRAGFMEDLTHHIAAIRRDEDVQFFVAFVDLDGFKQVNDCCGHEVGDKALKDVGQCLSSHFRVTDTVARIGGDEMALIISTHKEHLPLDEFWVKHRIRHAMDGLIYWDAQNNPHPIGASIGVSELHLDSILPYYEMSDTEIAETILRNADKQMYEDKREGKMQRLLVAEKLALLVAAQDNMVAA